MSHEVSHGHESDVAVEPDHPRSGLIALVTGGFAVATLGLLAVFNGLMMATVEGEVHRKVLEPESTALRTLRAGESEKLSRYQWVDRQAGVVRLPIQRAAELVLDRYAEKSPETETGARK